MEYVYLRMWHGGQFMKVPELAYIGGQCKIFDQIDTDELCIFLLKELALRCGKYTKIDGVYYVVPGLSMDEGLRRVYTDKEVLDISKYVMLHGVIDLYVSHEVEGYTMSNEPEIPLRYEDICEEIEDDECELGNGGDELIEEEDDDNSEIDKNGDEFEDCTLRSDSDTDDDEFKATRETLNQFKAKLKNIAEQLQREAEEGRVSVKNLQCTNDKKECLEHNSDYETSEDEILTPGESEEDDIIGKKRKARGVQITEFTDFSKLKWEVGMRFQNRKSFKDAVTKYAIFQGRHLTFKISDKKRQQRLGVYCKEGCPFRLYASWDSRRACFVVKSVDSKHNCSRDMESNKQMKSTWLAEQFLEVFKSRHHWPASEIVDTVRRAYKVIIKKSFAYKVKYCAHRKPHGSMKDHYNKVGRYLEAIKQLNPDSSFILVTDPSIDLGPPVFKRLFIGFDALITGWLSGCRKVICLDGCFLKTFLGGMLLAAVGRDGNDQMFPIAYAIVEGENNDSWNWFLLDLRRCLKEINEGNNWTFISDQQKGIINAVAGVFAKAEHRNCARHVYANWHKTFKGDELKGLFWRAARAYNEVDFIDAMTEMENVNPSAVTAFKAQNPKTFCRAFVKTDTKCDVIVNNMAETFNAYIISARTKHLLDMLEDIRTALMQRLVKKRAEIEKNDSILCPKIVAKLEKEKHELGNCYSMPSSAVIFQVSHKLDNLIVDLQQKTCTCRRWQLTGIPCCHALVCIYFKRLEVEPFVDKCYYKSTNLKAYSGAIKPCTGERHWPRVDISIDPPPIKVGPGRPRRNRRKHPHENPKKSGRLTRHGAILKCSVCKFEQHTKRKCPDKDKVEEQQPKRARGRPKTYEEPVEGTTHQARLTEHHSITAEPTRTGRYGRTVRSGRGSRGGRDRGGRTRMSLVHPTSTTPTCTVMPSLNS